MDELNTIWTWIIFGIQLLLIFSVGIIGGYEVAELGKRHAKKGENKNEHNDG